jgi:methylthioribose-1-phosphate isomerase
MTRDRKPHRPIWLSDDGHKIVVIDQRRLPDEHILMELATVNDAIFAIKAMVVRGARSRGRHGMVLVARAPRRLGRSKGGGVAPGGRATHAVNLAWANGLEGDPPRPNLASGPPGAGGIRHRRRGSRKPPQDRLTGCRSSGALARARGQTVNVLTHCNAGWLACGIRHCHRAHLRGVDRGIDLHVWVDETRPLNQGARLTAWELAEYGVKHTLITDNAGGHLMQRGQVDLVIVGTDRTTAAGDVANKIGTYLKALAARDNNIPFYVALPSSTFDWNLSDGALEIPIEERDPDEVRWVQGWNGEGQTRVRVCPEASPAANFAFDVTPARLITGLITERGVCRATAEDIRRMFPDKVK